MNLEIQEILNKHAFAIYEFTQGSNHNVLRGLNNDLHIYLKKNPPNYHSKIWWGDDDRQWWLINFGIPGLVPVIKTQAKKVKYYTCLGNRVDIFEEEEDKWKRILFRIKI